LIASQLGGRGVRFEQPDGAIAVVTQKLPIFGIAQIARPDDTCAIDIGCVIDPLVLKDVPWPVAYKYQLISRRVFELPFDARARTRAVGFEETP
jgi:hypothetical protein